MKIAIIGGGLSGLVCAHHLIGENEVTIFEKSRGVSGRMSTRYADPYQFDHGAQYFTARSKEFKAFLGQDISEEIVQEWRPKIVTLEKDKKPYKRDWFEAHYVVTPKMNSLCKYLSNDLDVRLGVHIENISKTNEGWSLEDKEGNHYGPFDWVISSAPAPQTASLFPSHFVEYNFLEKVCMLGCFSLMLGFSEPLKLNWQAAMVKNSSIGWISINSDKPGRETDFSLLVQSTSEWAEEYMNSDKDELQALMLEELSELLECDIKYSHVSFHSWKYANTSQPAGKDFLIDEAMGLAACGDWCIEGRVEAAFLKE